MVDRKGKKESLGVRRRDRSHGSERDRFPRPNISRSNNGGRAKALINGKIYMPRHFTEKIDRVQLRHVFSFVGTTSGPGKTIATPCDLSHPFLAFGTSRLHAMVTTREFGQVSLFHILLVISKPCFKVKHET